MSDCCGKATNTYFIDFGLTRPGLEPTIYRTRDDVFTLYRCCVVSLFVFIGLMCLLCITVVLLVLVFLVVWCVYFVSLLCCQSLYFYWFDVFTLYHCCVVSPFIFSGLMCLLCITVVLLVLLFLVVWCVYFVSLLCC